MGLVVGICGGLIIYLIYYSLSGMVNGLDKLRTKRLRNTLPVKDMLPVEHVSTIRLETQTVKTEPNASKDIELASSVAQQLAPHESVIVAEVEEVLSELVLAHKAATEEYYVYKRDWFDYRRFAEVDESRRLIVQERSKKLTNKLNNSYPVLSLAEFDGLCYDFRLPEKEIEKLLSLAKKQTQALNAYELLKLLLPHHFLHNFKRDRQPICMNRYGETYTNWSLPLGYSGITEKEQAYSRSYLARLIVVSGFDWREVIQATEYMMRKAVITKPAQEVRDELEAIRWCVKYWHRAYVFNEPINFDHSTSQFRSRSKPGKSVSDYKVPSTLQLPALHIQNDYAIILAHMPKKKAG